jgi:hypothetical protein
MLYYFLPVAISNIKTVALVLIKKSDPSILRDKLFEKIGFLALLGANPFISLIPVLMFSLCLRRRSLSLSSLPYGLAVALAFALSLM